MKKTEGRKSHETVPLICVPAISSLSIQVWSAWETSYTRTAT
jgi:hypothetical protein